MTKIIRITETFNLTPDSTHPLIVEATVACHRVVDEHGMLGWDWTVEEIHLVELQLGLGATSCNLTQEVLASPMKKAIIESSVASDEEKIYEALAEKENAA